MSKRQGNDPKRRIARKGTIAPGILERLAGEMRYVGSAHHKRQPADYGLHPPVNPRRNKSMCGAIEKAQAQALFREGIGQGMVSGFRKNGLPKYVWAVDSNGRAYEAVLGSGRDYHGYMLGREDPGRRGVIEEWRERCPTC